MANLNIENPIKITEATLLLPVPLGGLTIEAEAAEINSFYDKIEQTNRNLTEIKTAQWAQLGLMMSHHKQRVEAKGIKWTQYVVEKFPWLKERRRQQCMALDEFGDRVKPYYFMGIDRIYDLFNKLIQHQNDPDFDHIRSRYAYIFDPAMKSLPEKEDVKVKADVIRNFFKFKNQVKRNDYNKDLVLDVLETGCTFQSKDYKLLKDQSSVTPEKIEEYLLGMMVTASSPAASQSPSSNSRISIQIILSQLLQTVQGYNAERAMPEFLDTEILDTVLGELTTLRHRMGNPSNDQEVF